MKPEEKVKALLEETKAIIDNLLKDIEDDGPLNVIGEASEVMWELVYDYKYLAEELNGIDFE